VNRWLRHSSIP